MVRKWKGWCVILNQIIHGDCLEIMKDILDKSIDMILCDLPYGTTACKWDSIIPFEPLWEQYERIIKDNRAIVLFGSQPFTSALVMSNPNIFKYEWIWNKRNISNPFLAKYQPLKQHESILVFGKGTVNYYPIMTPRDKVRKYKDKYGGGEAFNKKGTGEKEYTLKFKYPKSILEYTNAIQKGKLHPTQKPVALFEYLIKTYTNEGEIVLDNCIGSGTTAIAALNTGRFFIGIEKEEKYVEIARKRIAEHTQRQSIV
jgi:site-specific DNA-methyltransferase (adenine-specific)